MQKNQYNNSHLSRDIGNLLFQGTLGSLGMPEQNIKWSNCSFYGYLTTCKKCFIPHVEYELLKFKKSCNLTCSVHFHL